MRRVLLAVVLATLAAGSARAQLTSDDVPQVRTIPVKEEVDADMQAARFHLGPVRIIPTIAVRNAGYDNNVFGTTENPVSDWSFAIRGGFRFIVPFGSKIYLRASALPEYTWYDKLEDRRGWGGLYEASLYGFFNRMTTQLRAFDLETFQQYSSEVPTKVLTRSQDGSAGFEIEILKRLAFFAKAEGMRIRYSTEGQLPGQPVQANDRTDTSVRGGPRYYLSPDWSISAAVEQTWSDFVYLPGTRDNQSRAYLLGVQYTRPRLYFNLSGGYRTGDPRSLALPLVLHRHGLVLCILLRAPLAGVPGLRTPKRAVQLDGGQPVLLREPHRGSDQPGGPGARLASRIRGDGAQPIPGRAGRERHGGPPPRPDHPLRRRRLDDRLSAGRADGARDPDGVRFEFISGIRSEPTWQ